MVELYLILHKVRSEPAFDIAQRIQIGDEEGWIIPTSGHRAHPYASWLLSDLMAPRATKPVSSAMEGPLPDPWPDHYTINAQPKAILTNVSSLLASIGLSAPVKKRKA